MYAKEAYLAIKYSLAESSLQTNTHQRLFPFTKKNPKQKTDYSCCVHKIWTL